VQCLHQANKNITVYLSAGQMMAKLFVQLPEPKDCSVVIFSKFWHCMNLFPIGQL